MVVIYMLRNTHISHILLLCVIAFVIYQLCKPKEDSIKNSGTLEEISDTNSEIVEEPEVQEAGESVEAEPIEDTEEIANGVVTEADIEITPTEIVENNEFGGVESNEGASIEVAYEKTLDEDTVKNSIDFNKNTLNEFKSSDYLPKDEEKDWFDTDFSMAKNVPSDKLINDDKYIIGVDTVGQSLKNPSWDLRGTVAISKFSVSPWLNSTYEPDYNIKPLC